MSNPHLGLHPAVTIDVGGQSVRVDEGVASLVLWMNTLPGVKTITSCQGGPECRNPEAFVGYSCDNGEAMLAIRHTTHPRARVFPEGSDVYRLTFDDPEDLVRLNREGFPS